MRTKLDYYKDKIPFEVLAPLHLKRLTLALDSGDTQTMLVAMCNAERVMDHFVRAVGNLPLQPLLHGLRRTLTLVWRAARRVLIKRALQCPASEIAAYDKTFAEFALDDEHSEADFHAVCRHLDKGEPLFADLRRQLN
jgi:hypothetical protein